MATNYISPYERRARAQAIRAERESRRAIYNNRLNQINAPQTAQNISNSAEVQTANQSEASPLVRGFATAGDVIGNVLTGAAKGLEGIFDLGASIVGAIGGIFDSSTVTVIPVYQFLLCVVVSLLLGIVLAAAYTYKSKYNAGFVRTLAILPAVVCIVIMMVNGNVGTGVAVAGVIFKIALYVCVVVLLFWIVSEVCRAVQKRSERFLLPWEQVW